MSRRTVYILVVIAVAVILAVLLYLRYGGTPVPPEVAAVVEKRQEAMKGMGSHVKAIKAFVEKGEGDAADVARRADEIAETAPNIPDLFPEGTGMEDNAGETGAKPAIWSEHEAFIVAANQLQERAQALSAAAGEGDVALIAERFAEMGKQGCGNCHDKFREKLD